MELTRRTTLAVVIVAIVAALAATSGAASPVEPDHPHTVPVPPRTAPVVASAVVAPPTLEVRPPIRPGDFPVQVEGAGALHVKFVDDSGVRVVDSGIAGLGAGAVAAVNQVLADADAEVAPLFDRPRAELQAQRTELGRSLGEDPVDLRTWVRVTVAEPADPAVLALLADRLNALDVVEAALVEPHVAPAALPAQGTPDLEADQSYRMPAPTGVDADYAATIAGGTGAAVTLTDIEYSWNTGHEDLTDAVGAELANGTPEDPFDSPDHGTAVLGIVAAEDNGFGVTGIVPDAPLQLVNVHTTDGQALTDALALATANSVAGDVMLVEQQLCPEPIIGSSCPGGWLPVEWFPSYYDGIVAAVGSGIHVVQPAGNGGRNVDVTLPMPDSGAILVGAGNAPGCTTFGAEPALGRLNFSNHGERIDLQAHGACVWTTGPEGLAPPPPDPDVAYTGLFNGTSASSAIVAGAVVALAGVSKTAGDPLAPNELRALLRATGTPQNLSLDQREVGPQPDLRAAIDTYLAGPDPAPANDDFHDPAPIGTLPATVVQPTSGSSVQVGEPVSTCGFPDRTVWFRYEPPISGRVSVTVAQSTVPPSLAVWWQSDPDTLTQQGCHRSGAAEPAIDVDVLAGETYLIQVGDTGAPITLGLRGAQGCDVDGDGWADLVVGIPGEGVRGNDDAGAIQLVHGGDPSSPTRSRQLHAASAGMAGAAEADDRFGSAVACGDIDGDGHDDVVVGIPGEDRGDRVDSGAIHVIPGSPAGLDTERDRFVSQSTAQVPGSAEAGDGFGSAVAVGDLNGDGFADVAVGAPGEALGAIDAAGMVVVLFGSPDGLDLDTGVAFHQDTPGVPGGAEAGDAFGGALAVGDVDDDGVADLLIGVPGEGLAGFVGVGAATLVPGGIGGPDPGAAQWLAPTQSQVASPATAGRAFGQTVAIGDLDGDGDADAAIGSSGSRKGGVDLFLGGGGGLDATGVRLRLGRDGVPAPAGARASFSRSLTLVDVTGDGRAEVLAGAPTGDGGASRAGVVVVVSLDDELVVTAASAVDQQEPGLPGAGDDDAMGTALAGADLDGDGFTDLVAGIPGKAVKGRMEAGALVVLPGAPGGPSVAGAWRLDQTSEGLPGRADTGDRFASALS